MTKVYRCYNETADELLDRFKKKVRRDGVLESARRHHHFMTPAEKRNRKRQAAQRRKRNRAK